MIDIATLEILAEASRRNESEWRNDNKGRLLSAQQNLIQFTSELAKHASQIDGRVSDANPDPRKCLARGSLAKGVGTISFRVLPMRNAAATYFIKVTPRQSYSGGGAPVLSPRHARILRQTIASHTGKWRGVVEGAVFREYFPNGLTGGHDLGSKGFIKNHDALDFFNLKNFGACRNIPDDMLTSSRLVQEVVKSFAAARPLVDYINRSTVMLA